MFRTTPTATGEIRMRSLIAGVGGRRRSVSGVGQVAWLEHGAIQGLVIAIQGFNDSRISDQ
jgi:hypothetical protein